MTLTRQEFKKMKELLQKGDGISLLALLKVFKTAARVEEWLSLPNRSNKLSETK